MTEPQQKNNKIDENINIQPLNRLRDRLMPYQREIMLTGMFILIALVVFLGFARGGLEVCNSVGGHFDWKLKCRPLLFNWTEGIDTCYDDVGQTFMVPKFEAIENELG